MDDPMHSVKKGDLKLKSSTIVGKKIVEEIKSLPLPQQKKILEVVRLLKTGIEVKHKSDITELRGCGKNIWVGIDAQKYVNKLREEWN